MTLTPKNWKTFQHYGDRKPGWIKLHRTLLDDFDFARLPLASRALAPMLWLLASEYEGGGITATTAEIAFRLRVTEDDLLSALKPLIDSGFFVASEPLASCEQSACLEKEKEEQVTSNKNISRAVAGATRPAVEAKFDEFWKAYPKRDGANPKAPALKKFTAAVRSGANSEAIIAGATRYASEERERGKIGTAYIAQAVTWLGQSRWQDYLAPSAEVVPIAGFYAKVESPQFEAWNNHYRATRERCLGAPRDRDGGWRFPSEWPPGHPGNKGNGGSDVARSDPVAASGDRVPDVHHRGADARARDGAGVLPLGEAAAIAVVGAEAGRQV